MAFEYFEYLDALKVAGDQYDDCPFECPNAEKKYDFSRSAFCETCPKRRQKELFKRQTLEAIEVKLGEDRVKKYVFEDLVRQISMVAALERLGPDQISLKSSSLLSIYLNERSASRDQASKAS